MSSERQPTLPPSWRTACIHEIVDSSRPVTYGIVQPGPRLAAGVPIIRGKDYSSGVVDDSDLYHVHPAIAAAYQRSTVRGGDILFSIVGYVGQTALVPDHLEGANITQTTARIAVAEPNSQHYFLQQFRSGFFLPEIRRFQKGSAQPGLNLADVEKMIVIIPPAPEQWRIAEILDTADEAIRATERVIAKLKMIKQGLLHDLLTRGLDKNGELRDPVRRPEQFKDSPLGMIPKRWESTLIGDLAVHVGSGATPRGGSEVYKSEGVVFVRSQNVTFEGLLLDDVAYIDAKTHQEMARSAIFPHDVLLNITGASIGRCCSVPGDFGLANVNQHVCLIRLPKPREEDAAFLSAVLGSHIGQHQIYRLNAGGNREGLNSQQLRSFVIPWPSDKERAGIAGVLELHVTRICSEEAILSKLRQIKRGLMDDLLTGRVRVGEVGKT